MTDQPPTPGDSPPSAAGESKPNRMLFWRSSIVIFIVVLVVDQLTKIWAFGRLRPAWYDDVILGFDVDFTKETITLIPGLLQLRYAENTGAAFSILEGQTAMLAVISLIAVALLTVMWFYVPPLERWGRWGVALIVGGALGNGIDRVFRGAVVDFIDAYVGDYHWPTFNIADMAICSGAAILIVLLIRGKI